MATKKECKCLEAIAHVVSDAVGLEELAVIQQHFGNLKFKKEEKYIKPPGDSIRDLIKRDAISLKKNIGELDKHCDTTGSDVYRKELYVEGKKALDTTIKRINSKMLSNGTATMAASAGSQINDFIQENVYVGKFMRCIKYD